MTELLPLVLSGLLTLTQPSADAPSIPKRPVTVDALLSYEVAPTFTINLGAFNVLNESYFNPQDVVQVLTANPNLELFRAPGRSWAMNATVRW